MIPNGFIQDLLSRADIVDVVGRHVQLKKAGISADQAKQLFFAGSDVNLKFQVKMIKKSYFELVAVVDSAEPTTDGGVRISAKFTKVSDSDRNALVQFADDMAYLKRQLPGK